MHQAAVMLVFYSKSKKINISNDIYKMNLRGEDVALIEKYTSQDKLPQSLSCLPGARAGYGPSILFILNQLSPVLPDIDNNNVNDLYIDRLMDHEYWFNINPYWSSKVCSVMFDKYSWSKKYKKDAKWALSNKDAFCTLF